MSQRLRVTCTLKDCAWWHAVAERTSKDACDCSHPDKQTYLYSMPCPLYKKDWHEKAESAKELAGRFSRRGGRGLP